MLQVFHTFREASEFAANYCRANRCTAKLYRQDDDWAVKVDTLSKQSESRYGSTEEAVKTEPQGWRSEDAEKLKAELSARREQLLRLAKSGALKHMQLSLIIDNAQSYAFTEKELAQLRDIQSRAGSQSEQTPEMCPSCGMVGSNCTCGRSWF